MAERRICVVQAAVPRKGDRVRLVVMRSASDPLPPGAEGTVWHVDELQILVTWDGGRSLPLRPGSTSSRFSIGRRRSAPEAISGNGLERGVSRGRRFLL